MMVAMAATAQKIKREGNAHRADILQAMQNTLGAMRDCYEVDSAQFEALLLAYESVRVAWYMVSQGDDGGKLELVEGALREVGRRFRRGNV